MTTVTYQGVSVFAPANWGHNGLRCGTPVENTVVVNPGPIPVCMILSAPRVSYVWLRPSEDLRVDPEAAVARQPAGVSGQAARRGEDRLPDGRTRVVLVIPDRKVVVVGEHLVLDVVGGIVAAVTVTLVLGARRRRQWARRPRPGLRAQYPPVIAPMLVPTIRSGSTPRRATRRQPRR